MNSLSLSDYRAANLRLRVSQHNIIDLLSISLERLGRLIAESNNTRLNNASQYRFIASKSLSPLDYILHRVLSMFAACGDIDKKPTLVTPSPKLFDPARPGRLGPVHHAHV